MKPKVAVVGDCAFVLADLMPYLSLDFDIEFIRYSRGVWDKTAGLFLKLLPVKADLFHVNYALQGAFLVNALKKLDVLHLHGSDIRWTANSPFLGWMVRRNVAKARKVLYATPDLETIVKRYRPDAVYLPTPVKTDVFTPKQTFNNPLRAVYFKLHYETLPPTIPLLLEKYGIQLTVLERNIPYEKMPALLKGFDIFIGVFTIPGLSKTNLEAMSCGLLSIDFRFKNCLEPWISRIAKMDEDVLKDVSRQNRAYVLEYHDARKVAKTLSQIWRETLCT